MARLSHVKRKVVNRRARTRSPRGVQTVFCRFAERQFKGQFPATLGFAEGMIKVEAVDGSDRLARGISRDSDPNTRCRSATTRTFMSVDVEGHTPLSVHIGSFTEFRFRGAADQGA